MEENRLRWIYSATSPTELRERYDRWAAEYDADLGAMAWVAPQACAERCIHFAGAGAAVLDAGCGTGLVGLALRAEGVGRLVGFDLSAAMLDVARGRNMYDELVLGSLLEPLPFAPGSFDAAVAVGVFTIGHVGPEALRSLAVVVRPGGHVSLAFRDDVIDEFGYAAEVARLEQDGMWTLVECTEPAPLILEGGVGAAMRVWTWRVAG